MSVLEPLPDEMASRVVDQMFDLFVMPEVERRGLPDNRGAIQKALVTFPPGGSPVVALNDEVELSVQAEATRPIEAGEEISFADINPESIRGLRPVSIDPDSGWLAIAQVLPGSFILAFDFTRNRSRALRLLDKAQSFLEAAQDSLSGERLSPAIDAAFSAAELSVTAMMHLLFDDVDKGRNQHKRRLQWFAQWTKLGNSPEEFRKLLGRLATLRPAARYGDGELPGSGEVAGMLADVESLIQHARTRVGEPLPALPTPPDDC